MNRTMAGEPAILRKEEMMGGMMGGGPGAADGTSLIARAEALNAFMRMQPAANLARGGVRSAVREREQQQQPVWGEEEGVACFCFGGGGGGRVEERERVDRRERPRREYYPDNLSVQPKKHPWARHMEWLIVACVDFLEARGLDERNLFAVSAVEDLVTNMDVALGVSLPRNTDPHVAAGVVKMQIRHASQPLVAKECLKEYIETQGAPAAPADAVVVAASAPTFAASHLARTIDTTERGAGARRAYILARLMRLLGRVSANVEVSRMNAHCLAKCVAPSMLHWDPNSSFALLMLGKITAYVMAMIEDARMFDELLCQRIDALDAAYKLQQSSTAQH